MDFSRGFAFLLCRTGPLFAASLILTACPKPKSGFSFSENSSNNPTAVIDTVGSFRATSSRNIALSLQAENATEMAFFLNKPCSYKEASDWEPYENSKTLQLPDQDGRHRIAVLFRNEDHFHSGCQSLEIVLDREGPRAPALLSLRKDVTDTLKTPNFSFYPAVDVASEVAKHQARVIDIATESVVLDWTDLPALPISSWHEVAGLILVEGRTYAIEVRGVDSLGLEGQVSRSTLFYSGPYLTAADFSADFEGVFKIPVILSTVAARDVVVSYQTEAVTALPGLDYFDKNGSITIPAGQTTGSFLVNFTGHFHPGPRRSFKVRFSSTQALVSDAEITLHVPENGGEGAVEAMDIQEIHNQCLLKDGIPYCWTYASPGSKQVTPLNGEVATRITSYSDGYRCAVTVSGLVRCWGSRANSLGDVAGTSSGLATSFDGVTVPLDAAAIDVKTAYNVTCALKENGGMACWGWGAGKKIGSGRTTVNGPGTPENVAGFENPGPSDPKILQFAVGHADVCALVNDGSVRCWGNSSSATPTAMPGLSGLIGLGTMSGGSTGLTFCAWSHSRVWCWGSNSYGNLGLPLTTTSSWTPVEITGLPSFQSVAVSGVGACVLSMAGVPWCWGLNRWGQVGSSRAETILTPIAHPLWTGTATALYALPHSYCASKSDGTFLCWGGTNYGAYIGPPWGRNASMSPAVLKTWSLAGGEKIKDIRADYSQVCVQLESDQWKCAGVNIQGSFSSHAMESFDAELVSTEPLLTVASGLNHTCVLRKSDRQVLCKGDNSLGQLGQGNTAAYTGFVAVPGLSGDVVQLSIGYAFTCSLHLDGRVRCWGRNSSGQTGQPTSSLIVTTPSLVSGLPAVDQLSSLNHTSCAITADAQNDVYCWGFNGNSELGDGTITNRPSPAKVLGAGPAEKVAVGEAHVCAQGVTGGLKCWGWNGDGQLGDGTYIARGTPTPVSGLSGVTDLSPGGAMTCIVSEGKVLCSGFGGNGSLGRGVLSSANTFDSVSHLEGGAVKVETLMFYDSTRSSIRNAACALIRLPDSETAVKCWGGLGEFGQGVGQNSPRPRPVYILEGAP